MQTLTKQSSQETNSALPNQKRRIGILCLVTFSLWSGNACCKPTIPGLRPTIHTVGSNADSGPGSLRDAIIKAAQSPGADVINFDLKSDALRIRLQSPLPAIGNGVTIDGFNKSGGRVELDGSQARPDASGPANGLKIIGARNAIKGLVIHSFQGHGILISKELAANTTNAGEIAGKLNKNTRQTQKQFFFWENQVIDNYIGTDSTGTKPMEPMVEGKDGIFVGLNSANVLIERNRIAYNKGNGVSLPDGPNPPVGIRISRNLIFLNRGIGIDLGNDGHTPNDQHAGGRDGPNHWQPHPILRLVNTRQPAPIRRGFGFLPEAFAATMSVTINISFPPRLLPGDRYTIELQACSCSLNCPNCTDACLACGRACRNCTEVCPSPASICSGTTSLLCMPSVIPTGPIVKTSNSDGSMGSFNLPITLPIGFKGMIYAVAIHESGDSSEKSNCVPVP
ncbi:MAG: right-handed parallel beta-helix repeat-containing protein [Blastocatellia bacterium]